MIPRALHLLSILFGVFLGWHMRTMPFFEHLFR
jgi:hypothetical protein